ncbi:hypothetical protein [Vreelandella jeotgali]|uniref:hypothetical protein n=1 Tax=Vreelandella jeotgali TaxID=553386 RepID=UPI00047692D5|nr:hypothetical protein [Halomonas jeotgali]
MRDLYQRLSLPPKASPRQIRRAVDTCPNRALQQDADAVLTVAEHRDSYDALHATVSDISRLRARLGLSHGAHWQGSVANDFACPPDDAVGQNAALMGRVSQAATHYNRWQRLRGPWLITAAIITAACMGFAGGLALCLRLGAL